MNTINLLLFFSFLFLPADLPKVEIQGTVTEIFDGNTLEVSTPEKEYYRVVLAGIDCPELTQPYGIESKAALEKWLLNEKVVLSIHGKDRLKNYIGVVLLQDEADEPDPRFMLLSRGLAWTSEKNPDPLLETIRMQAAANRKGLWKEDEPTPPWIHRRQQSMQEAKSR